MIPATLDPTIRSEDIEPTMAYLIARWFAKCEAAKATGNIDKILGACGDLWMGLTGLRKVVVASRDPVHASLALSTHTVRLANYIEAQTGIDPMKEWKF